MKLLNKNFQSRRSMKYERLNFSTRLKIFINDLLNNAVINCRSVSVKYSIRSNSAQGQRRVGCRSGKFLFFVNLERVVERFSVTPSKSQNLGIF